MELNYIENLNKAIKSYAFDCQTFCREPYRIDFHGIEKRILSCLEKFINQIETRRKKLEELKIKKVYELDDLDDNGKNALAGKLKSLLSTLVVTMTEVRVSRKDNWNRDPNKSFFTYGLKAWKKPNVSKLLSSELDPNKVFDLEKKR